MEGIVIKNIKERAKEFRFRLAQKYGMVKIEDWDEKFYYEKKEEQI